MAETQQNGDTRKDIVAFKLPLPHLTQSLKDGPKTKIIAIGSSSTEGEGNIVAFPARLELLLRGKFRGKRIYVVNQGVGGQEATTEFDRFEPDVIAEAPALVIWQVGTNAVFRDQDFNFEAVVNAIETGLARLSGISADVILMDLQYTTAVVKPEKKALADKMEARISTAAAKAGVNVFRRFALMESWQQVIPIEALINPTDPEKLHMSDWATNLVSQALFEAITEAPVVAT